MKKSLYALLLLCIPMLACAAAGDTTWVQVNNNIQLSHYGAYDTGVRFPAATNSYRKIYMVFTLGTYNCITGSQYCHQWDYDVHNILMTPAGDTVELSRFITPYANTGVPSFPSGWKYRYIFDVTDYYPLLKDSAALRIFYSGYSWGFTGDVKFAFVKGTPERNVLGISSLWTGSYAYGKASDPIDNHVTAQTRTTPAGTQSVDLKLNITGHGADANQCCEFASHNYYVKVNGATTATQAIWRSDCGSNELYPQGGTWIYERANWCPGSLVIPFTHNLVSMPAGNTFTADLDFDPYTNSNTNYGSYNIQGNAIYYAGFNKTVDASLEDIIAPSDFEGHFRENPSNGQPVITIRNTGRDTIKTMDIVYGVKDSAMSTYTMSGQLRPLHEMQLQLPELPAIRNMSLNGASGTYGFIARIANVNGTADKDAGNDTLRSSFTVTPTWPSTIVVNMKTSSIGENGNNNGQSENSWQITNAVGTIVASRTGASLRTIYPDTVSMPVPGFYTLTVKSTGCDGLHWWPYDQDTSIHAGSISVRNGQTGSVLPMRGNTTSGTFNNDFGCGFSQNFTVKGWPAGIQNTQAAATPVIAVFPNPASTSINVSLYGLSHIHGELRIQDAVGRTVVRLTTASAGNIIDVAGLSSGVYNVIYLDAAGSRISSRLTIAR